MSDQPADDLRYDEDGNLYRVECELGNPLNPHRYVVHQQYENSDGVPYDEGEATVWEKPLYRTAPRRKVDGVIANLNAEITKLYERRAQLQAELRTDENVLRARMGKLKRHEALAHLDDFLDGKITHFVVQDYGPPGIVALEDCVSDVERHDHPKRIRLLALHGRTNGDLTWELNRHSDGSGSWTLVFPYTSIETARAKWQELFQQHIEQTQQARAAPGENWIRAAELACVPVPEWYRRAVAESRRVSALRGMARLREELAKLEKEVGP